MARQGRLFGHLDGIENGVVRGWAAQKQFMGAYVEVQVCVFYEGSTIAYARANIYRADLEKAGFANGCFGFRIKLPDAVLNGGPYKLLIGDSNGRGLADANIFLLNGERVLESAGDIDQDDFLKAHARYQYRTLDSAICEAIIINKEVGSFAASAFIYACLLGRMPELAISSQLSDVKFDELGIKEFAHKVFYSSEAVRRREI